MSGGLKDQFPEVRRRYDGTWGIAISAKPKAGEERDFEIAKGVNMRFCWIPVGKATLGSPVNEFDHQEDESEHVFETKGFWLGKYEVTQDEWTGVMGAGSNPSGFRGAKLPVERVSWEECQQFVRICQSKGWRAKLPHEDEWEYACRGGIGNARAYYWGGVLRGDKANHNGNFPCGTPMKGEWIQQSTIVGRYEKTAPHPWGLCDMSGNVWEWCENLYSFRGSDRVLRGGSWINDSKCCRSADRNWNVPTYRYPDVGFRIALDR